VHVYTIGYMHDDPGYQRFFSYISLFTFSMLMLVMSNNFLQLFFGWEAVGVVSYLLIGFWYTRPTAIFANMKAFLVNRVGDFGFLLGIAALATATGTLDYALTFGDAERLSGETIEIISGTPWALLHVLVHLPIRRRDGQVGAGAAARLAAGFDGGPDADFRFDPCGDDGHGRHFHGRAHVAAVRAQRGRAERGHHHRRDHGVLHRAARNRAAGHQARDRILDALAARLHDLSPSVRSAYAAGIFHLMTHAFFKALLFLAAGSVIIAMHHEQDIRKMGGLRKYLPITYWTSVIGTLALIGFPGFSGFFSKDALIEAVHASETPATSSRIGPCSLACSLRPFTAFVSYSSCSTAKSAWTTTRRSISTRHRGS
jgi:NADH-quinone oxidoreductase subunit L